MQKSNVIINFGLGVLIKKTKPLLDKNTKKNELRNTNLLFTSSWSPSDWQMEAQPKYKMI